MELIVVQLPRGWHALVRFDPVRRTVTTTHLGLFMTLFQTGVRDFKGRRCFPRDGRRFFSALYDHLFLNGYNVQWLKPAKRTVSARNDVEKRS